MYEHARTQIGSESGVVLHRRAPPYKCPNSIQWAVLSLGDYHYGRSGYKEGDVVPLEDRDLWMLACTDCVKRLFKNVVFHPDVSFVYPCDRPHPRLRGCSAPLVEKTFCPPFLVPRFSRRREKRVRSESLARDSMRWPIGPSTWFASSGIRVC